MKYLKLDQKGSIMAEYIWVDSIGGVRSKSRVSSSLSSRAENTICVLVFPSRRPDSIASRRRIWTLAPQQRQSVSALDSKGANAR